MAAIFTGVEPERSNASPHYGGLERIRHDRLVPLMSPGISAAREIWSLSVFWRAVPFGDVNSMKMLDNLCHPVGVIKEAEELAAEAFGAAHAFFMVGGTTSAVQAMILASVKSGDDYSPAQCSPKCD